MANFIALVYATLKEEGIDTKGMSTDEAVAKFKEIQGKESPDDTKKKLNGEKEKETTKESAEDVKNKLNGGPIKKNDIVAKYTDGNHNYTIEKAPNGKYFNNYEGTSAGPFETEEEAKMMMLKHRPKAKEEGKKLEDGKYINKYPSIDKEDKVLAEFEDNLGKNIVIQAPNGKYFNVYDAENKGSRLVGNYESKEEAIKWLKKHRPSSKEI